MYSLSHWPPLMFNIILLTRWYRNSDVFLVMALRSHGYGTAHDSFILLMLDIWVKVVFLLWIMPPKRLVHIINAHAHAGKDARVQPSIHIFKVGKYFWTFSKWWFQLLLVPCSQGRPEVHFQLNKIRPIVHCSKGECPCGDGGVQRGLDRIIRKGQRRQDLSLIGKCREAELVPLLSFLSLLPTHQNKRNMAMSECVWKPHSRM